jgi:hypothetical protein
MFQIVSSFILFGLALKIYKREPKNLISFSFCFFLISIGILYILSFTFIKYIKPLLNL